MNSNKKSAAPKKKRKLAEIAEGPKNEEMNKNILIEPLWPSFMFGAQSVMENEEAAVALEPQKPVLRGGQISFHNRKVRTMQILDSLND